MVEVIERCGILILCFILLHKLWVYKHEDVSCMFHETSIKKIATRNLTLVGAYNDRMCISLRTRLMSLYRHYVIGSSISLSTVHQLLRDWVANDCIDPDNLILFCVDKVSSDFKEMANNFKDGRDVVNVPLGPAPKILWFNDYINIESLEDLFETLVDLEDISDVTKLDME